MPMPAYPGERLIDLTEATVTSAGCTDPAHAIDGDLTTFSVFAAETDPIDPIDGIVSTGTGGTGGGDGGSGAIEPTSRFLKVDWGEDRFLARVHLLVGGAGAANGAVAFESSLGRIESGNETDVILPHLTISGDGSDPGDGLDVQEIVLDVPPLARGLIYYPDYLLAEGSPSTPLVDLYEIGVYEPDDSNDPLEGNTPVSETLPTVQRARVGVSQVKVYPWNAAAGPYDDTVASQLFGLDSLEITKSVKTAKVTGGETTHQIGSYETERETKVKFTSSISDLNALHILLGGTLVVDPAANNLGEVQYFTENLGDRAPYFRCIARSTNGDGTDSYVFVKMKVDGNISYSLQKDKVTNLEFEATCYFDRTYVRQDAVVGGIFELLFGANGETVMHTGN